MAWIVTARGWAPAAGILLLAGSMVGACAKGIDDTDADDGGGANGPASSGATGGSGGSAGGAGGTGGDSNPQASSSSTGTPCDEMPCKLIAPQCGCAVDEKCTMTGAAMRTCAPDGTAQTGELCGSCVAGNQCLTTSGLGICREFCDADSQCNGPGGLCALEVDDGNGGVWPDKFCSENCDPVSSEGCTAAGSKCELGRESTGQQRYFSLCLGAGTSSQGATCTLSGDCAAGFGCFTVNAGPPEVRQCLQWCRVSAPICPGGTSCGSFTTPITIGSVEYGACL